jgi:high affinity sulfate transporter 1
VTLAAYLVPAAIGDAVLAGLPPQAGLYACMLSGLVFWLFCSSRVTAISVTSAISLVIGSALGGASGGDPGRHAALAACTALLVAAIALLAAVLRAGVVVHFISETVLVGFKAGVALYLASTQLPKLLGLEGTHGDFWQRMAWLLEHLGETHLPSLAVGLLALALLFAGHVFLPTRPVALLVVIAGIAVGAFGGLPDHGVKLVGHVPQGLPRLGMPDVHRADLDLLLPLAMACFLLSAVETVAVGRTFAKQHGYQLDANREFLALAAANGLAGLGQGLPVGGGMSQSVVNDAAGARTPLSGLVASGIVLLVALFLSGLLSHLPMPVLAAVILAAVLSLVKPEALRRIWRFGHGEFLVAVAALAGVLGSGLLPGVLVGAVISIVLLLRRSSFPPTVELGRVPGSDQFADRSRHPENERVPGVFVFRAGAGLVYFNVEYVRDRFFELLRARGEGTRLAVFALGTTPTLDLAGVDLMFELHDELRARGIELRLAEAHGPVRDVLRAAGFEAAHGAIAPDVTVEDEVERWAGADARSQGAGGRP